MTEGVRPIEKRAPGSRRTEQPAQSRRHHSRSTRAHREVYPATVPAVGRSGELRLRLSFVIIRSDLGRRAARGLGFTTEHGIDMGVRRIVTGHDARRKAVVISDADATNVVRPSHRPGVAIHNIWVIDGAPAPVEGPEETTDRTIGLLPPTRGSVFRVIEFPPEQDWIGSVDRDAAKAAWESIGAGHVGDTAAPPHPLMHRTDTVDYALCLEGEIVLVLDDSEVLVRAGDTVVQRGTNHAWSNRSDAVCKMMFVLVDGTR